MCALIKGFFYETVLTLTAPQDQSALATRAPINGEEFLRICEPTPVV